jgi:acylphosphatase
MSDRIARLLRIEGRVQGVGYRDWMVLAVGGTLDGWVRNRRDGSVEALVAGEAGAVAGMIAACRRGPPAARVAQVDEAEAEDPGAIGFARRPTA